MSVKLRLKRMGSKKRPFYRIIAADSRMPRDGRFIETLGYYNPVAEPAEIRIDEEGIFKWFERGAVPSTSAASLLRRVGALQKWELMKQGVKGEELANRVEAIKAQRDETAAKQEAEKKGQPSAKAREKQKAAAEAKAAEAEAPAEATPSETPAEDASSPAQEGPPEAPAEAEGEQKKPSDS